MESCKMVVPFSDVYGVHASFGTADHDHGPLSNRGHDGGEGPNGPVNLLRRHTNSHRLAWQKRIISVRRVESWIFV